MCILLKLCRHVTRNHSKRMNPNDFGDQKSKTTVTLNIYGNKLVNTIENNLFCASSSNLADMSTKIQKLGGLLISWLFRLIVAHFHLRIEIHFFVCIWKWDRRHRSWVNLLKREALLRDDLHATCVLSFPNANKKVYFKSYIYHPGKRVFGY